MVSALINVTLVVIAYSLWVRRDTWWSRWEVGVSTAIALEGVALALLSPWGSSTVGPLLYRAVGLWNVPHPIAWLCLFVAVSANIYHALVRLTDPRRARALMRRHLRVPVCLGAALMVVFFVIADEGSLSDGFAAAGTSGWFTAYWVMTGGLLIVLSCYATRVLLPLKADPRATETYRLYLTSSVFAIAGLIVEVGSVWLDVDTTAAVWLFMCLSVVIFALGSARSWRAKGAWFASSDRPDHRLAPESNPPQLPE